MRGYRPKLVDDATQKKYPQAIFEPDVSQLKRKLVAFNPNLRDFWFQIFSLASFLSHNSLRRGEVMIPRGNHVMHKNSPIKTSYKRWLVKLNDLEKKGHTPDLWNFIQTAIQAQPGSGSTRFKTATFLPPNFFDSSNFQNTYYISSLDISSRVLTI